MKALYKTFFWLLVICVCLVSLTSADTEEKQDAESKEADISSDNTTKSDEKDIHTDEDAKSVENLAKEADGSSDTVTAQKSEEKVKATVNTEISVEAASKQTAENPSIVQIIAKLFNSVTSLLKKLFNWKVLVTLVALKNLFGSTGNTYNSGKDIASGISKRYSKKITSAKKAKSKKID